MEEDDKRAFAFARAPRGAALLSFAFGLFTFAFLRRSAVDAPAFGDYGVAARGLLPR